MSEKPLIELVDDPDHEDQVAAVCHPMKVATTGDTSIDALTELWKTLIEMSEIPCPEPLNSCIWECNRMVNDEVMNGDSDE